MSVDAASVFLGHTSTAITESYDIEPDRTVDTTPAAALDRVLGQVPWTTRRSRARSPTTRRHSWTSSVPRPTARSGLGCGGSIAQ